MASVEQAAAEGWTGVKHMVRIDLSDPSGAGALELLGRVLEEARRAGLEALVETLVWRHGHMAGDVSSIVLAAVIAHDLGAPVLKVPVPDEPPGPARMDAVARVVASVGVPVLFLGGPRRAEGGDDIMSMARDVMAGGGAGMAVGRAVIEDPDPATAAKALAAVVHGDGSAA